MPGGQTDDQTPGGGPRLLTDRKLAFFVPGMPRPQGSMTPVVSKSTGKAFVKNKPTLIQWRNSITDRASDAARRVSWSIVNEAPIYMHCDFYFDRPKSHPKYVREGDYGLKHNGADLDKLVRAVGDALTNASVFGDDKQIVAITAMKRYSTAEKPQGAWVVVSAVGGELWE